MLPKRLHRPPSGLLFIGLIVLVSACQAPAPPLLANPSNEEWSAAAPERFEAEFETTQGVFVLAVTRAWAPRGADRFYNFVRLGFYDDQRFTRVVPEFICQWGVHGDPEVSQAWRSSTLLDDPVVASNTRGRIAYAMTGPDTRSTQVYISLVDNSRLDEQGFAPFGEVVEGMDVVDRLYSGYGEDAGGGMRRGDQDPLFAEGNTLIDRLYPDLDHIIKARIRAEHSTGGDPSTDS